MGLKVNELTKRFDRVVLDRFSYQFEPGHLYVIKGVSGCGKTTLLNILGGLDSDYEGEVSLDGETGREQLTASVGFVLQESLLIADLTIRDNLLLIRNDAAKIDTVMRRLGVSDLYDKYPDELSGGERQRIAVVRALIVGAKILLADEPTASLDEANSVEIATLLSELRKDGCTVIVATHEHYFNELADEILHLDYGRLDRVEVLPETGKEKNQTEAFGRKEGDSKKRTLARRKGCAEKRLKKGENLSLLRIVFVRGKKHWKRASLLPTMILVLLILLFSTVTKQSDAILLGYLEHYYPEDRFNINDKTMERLPEEFKEKMTVYYPYMAQENGVKAFYYAAQEDSILAVKGMLKYGSFPESPEEIIVSYEFAQERFGLIRVEEDIVGKKYTFLGREFVIAGCMHSFEEDIGIGLFFSAEGMFDSDAVYRRFRGSIIFVDYEVLKEIGELGETYYDMYSASYDGILRDEEARSILEGDEPDRYTINSIERIMNDTAYAMRMFLLILYFVLIVCFLIVCIFIRSKVEIELFYRSREIGFLQVFRMGKKKLRRMILWEYLVQLAVAVIVPVGVYSVLMVVASLCLNTVMIFDAVHMALVFGLLLLLYVQTLRGAIRKSLKRDVVELIRA